MTAHTLALALAYTGAVLGVVMVVPQILRTLAHPTLGGVSPMAWSMTVLGCSMWLTYGIRTMTVPQIPGNVLLVSGAVAVVLLVPSPASRRRRAATLGAVWAGFVAVALVVPPHLVGYIAVAIGFVSAWPQVYDSVVTWRAGVRSGVSITTWSIKAVSQMCWLSYALLATDVPVMISATVALGTSLTLVGLEYLAMLGDRTPEAYREGVVAEA
jgi:uncharacterized protein with PQ loop repeat